MQSVSQFQEQVPIKSDTRQNRVRLRPVALPVEHGGWGFSLEPVALGLLVAPSLLGLFLSVTTLAAFLARHPLKIAMSIALADGWQSSLAFGLWAILAARAVPSVLYVRARLKRLHRQEASTSKTIVIHVLAIAAASVLAWAKLVPVLSVVALSILLARTVYGFSRYDRQATARLIGFR